MCIPVDQTETYLIFSKFTCLIIKYLIVLLIMINDVVNIQSTNTVCAWDIL